MRLKKLKKRLGKNRKLSRSVLVGFVLFFIAGLTTATHFVLAQPGALEPIVMKLNPNIGIEARVREFFEANDAPEMIPIIKCESRFRHYEKDGTVLKNREGSSAVGVAQILSSVHPDPKVLQKFNRLNNTDLAVTDFNIETLDGNLAYALLLYQTRGTRDWKCAR